MKWSLEKAWPWIRDVLITGSGLGIIWSQVFSAHPSAELLAAGLGLTAPTIFKAREIIGGGTGTSGTPTSSSSSPPPGPGPGSSSPSSPGE